VDSDIQENAALQLGAKSGSVLKLPWFNPSEYDNVIKDSGFREMLGWREKIVVVCTRMHEKRYRIDTFLRAASLVLKENQNVRFLVCGIGSQTHRLKAIAKDLDIGRAVYFVGFLPRRQLVAVVEDCDIYVSTSETDGSSASLLEAMTAGLPCLVTGIPGNREWIEDARDGLLFKVGDHKALASMILRLSADGDLRASLGESAARSVRRRIRWQADSNALLGKLVALNKAQRLVRVEAHTE
jgi:glycosyltransferase involved in cell wall biosynthesis